MATPGLVCVVDLPASECAGGGLPRARGALGAGAVGQPHSRFTTLSPLAIDVLGAQIEAVAMDMWEPFAELGARAPGRCRGQDRLRPRTT